MSTAIGVCTTRAGQTSTFWAVSLAWTLAAERRVLLVDCDMEGGTVADVLYLPLHDQSIGNCFGERAADAQVLASQAMAVPDRPNLSVVPGLRKTYGFEMAECLRKVGPALRNQSVDIVVADLGHPIAHPALRSPRTAADAIAVCFQRVFVVIRDEPALVARSLEVLEGARLAHGEVIVCQQRSRAHQRLLRETFARRIPELAVRDGWSWDERRAQAMSESGRPMVLNGVEAQLTL